MGRRSSLFLGWALVFLGAVAAQARSDGEATCTVKYLSAEHVYLDAGSAAGLIAGLPARVVRGEQTIAELEVVFAAGFSASCKILTSTGDVVAGDVVVYFPVQAAEPPPERTVAPPPVRTRQFAPKPSLPVSEPGPRLTGYLAVQWDHSDETADRDLSSDFVSLPFRMRVANLGLGTELRARGSLRRILRSGYSAATPAAEWRNRIQELNISREDRRQDFQFALGRITSRTTASVGPFDGIRLARRVAGDLRLGVFGGYVPGWGDLAFGTDARVGGVFGNLSRISPQGRYLDVVLAGVGRYDGGEISREYFSLTTSWRDGSRLSLLHAAEVDVNRGWRKTAGRGALALTSLALTGTYRVNPAIRVNLGYDDRTPVRTWETRSLPDSLFTDAGRTGWRGGVTWGGARGRSLSLWASLRDRAGSDDRTTSWQGRAYLPRLPGADVDLTLSVRGFDGPYLSGWSPTAQLARSFRTGGRLAVEGGYYRYADIADTPSRDNTWLSMSGDRALGRRLTVSLEYRRDWGRDMAGNRWFLELRRRF